MLVLMPGAPNAMEASVSTCPGTRMTCSFSGRTQEADWLLYLLRRAAVMSLINVLARLFSSSVTDCSLSRFSRRDGPVASK